MSLVEQLGPHLPYLRRYARALTGMQKSGDSYVKAALQALAAGEAELEQLPPKVALYKLLAGVNRLETFHQPRNIGQLVFYEQEMRVFKVFNNQVDGIRHQRKIGLLQVSW